MLHRSSSTAATAHGLKLIYRGSSACVGVVPHADLPIIVEHLPERPYDGSPTAVAQEREYRARRAVERAAECYEKAERKVAAMSSNIVHAMGSAKVFHQDVVVLSAESSPWATTHGSAFLNDPFINACPSRFVAVVAMPRVLLVDVLERRAPALLAYLPTDGTPGRIDVVRADEHVSLHAIAANLDGPFAQGVDEFIFQWPSRETEPPTPKPRAQAKRRKSSLRARGSRHGHRRASDDPA